MALFLHCKDREIPQNFDVVPKKTVYLRGQVFNGLSP